jgi:RNA polymerase sigma factor (sigma-70 family)
LILNEQELLLACQRNDRKAQFALYERYRGKMLGICYRYARSSAEAEDILQEAFVKVFNVIHTLQKSQSLGGWIRSIVVNTAIDHYRLGLKTAFDVGYEEALDKSDDTFPAILSQMTTDEILAVIQQLPDGYRLVLNLYIIDGFQHHEIADKLSISVGTSKSQLSRAKELLRRKLTEMGMTENT